MQYTLKKSLGQHFLIDENICRKIIEALQRTAFTQLAEVGPGAGALTKYLLQLPGIHFKAIEIDAEKAAYLQETYPLIEGKILQADFLKIEAPFQDSFTVIGNFPYNISSQILFRILEWKNQVPVIIGMFQKEVAQRIAAAPGSKVYGILSVLIQAYYEVNYLFDVPPGAFRPPPKVMSGVIQLSRKAEVLSVKNEKAFIILVKTAFNQRRKTLRNATRALFDESVLQQEIFDKRAEQLNLDDFAKLTFSMK